MDIRLFYRIDERKLNLFLWDRGVMKYECNELVEYEVHLLKKKKKM